MHLHIEKENLVVTFHAKALETKETEVNLAVRGTLSPKEVQSIVNVIPMAAHIVSPLRPDAPPKAHDAAMSLALEKVEIILHDFRCKDIDEGDAQDRFYEVLELLK